MKLKVSLLLACASLAISTAVGCTDEPETPNRTPTGYPEGPKTMVDPATREHELGPLRAITDAFPKCVITLDRYGPGTTSDGIKVLGAID